MDSENRKKNDELKDDTFAGTDTSELKKMEKNGNGDIIPKISDDILKVTELADRIQSSYAGTLAPIIMQAELLNRVNIPLLQKTDLVKATKAVQLSTIRQRELIDSIKEPLKRIQRQVSDFEQRLADSLIQPYYNTLNDTVVNNLNPVLKGRILDLGESVNNIMLSHSFDIVSNTQLPIQKFLSGIDFSSLYGIFETIEGFDLSYQKEKINEFIREEAYDAKWFPHVFFIDDYEMVVQFWDIIDSTHKSNNRVKKIDSLVFQTYSKERIETMKKGWRKKDIPEYRMRMMHQAVQAYHRKEYAVTVVMLSTFWEGIIYDKVNDSGRKNGKKTKKYFENLISKTDSSELLNSFFKEYIMYDCNSDEEVKDDVPGRNSSAHSWYKKYPSRKAGLNAIIFTDFLLKLEPLEEDNNGQDETRIGGHEGEEH